MHPRLAPLPASLLNALGRRRHPQALIETLKLGEPALALLRAHRGEGPCRVPGAGKGLHLMLQPIPHEDAASQAPPAWGLQGFVLEASAGPGPWPEGLDPQQTPAADWPGLYGIDPAQALQTPSMSCFALPGATAGALWSVLGLFDPVTDTLQSLSLTHSGAWAADVQAPAAVLATAAPAATPARSPAADPLVTCGSADIVPKTGWYEGLLPADHPNYAYLSQAPGRFVRLHEGQRMLTLGVVPAIDEALVVWTWLREK